MALFCYSSQPSNGNLRQMHGGILDGNRDERDLEEENSLDPYDDYEKALYERDSDEDTEDASETDMVKQEACTEMKEQMYQEKLQSLRKQLQLLKDGIHPEYNKRMKKLDQTYKERLRLSDIFHKYELECVEREYINEKKAVAREFEEKKIELRESLIVDLEEKKKTIENERLTMEFTGGCPQDSMEVKPVTTRKLRRRPNDPVPLPEKRRKTSPAQLNYLLDDCQIMDDLKTLNKGKPLPLKKPTIEHASIMTPEVTMSDVRIEDCRLYYDKRWFQRGQPVYVESKETGKFAGIILTMVNSEVWIRKTLDHSKARLHLSQLQKGKYTIRRRST